MARSRRSGQGSRGSEGSAGQSVANRDNTNNEGEVRKMANVLTPEQIQAFLAGGRTKGAGEEVLRDFINSDEAGIEVDLTSGALAGKTPDSAFATLNNAKKRTKTTEDGQTVLAMPEASSVRVIKRNLGTKEAPDVHVFLIDTSKVSV